MLHFLAEKEIVKFCGFFSKFLLPSRLGHTINFCGVIKLLKFEGNILIFVWGENSCLVTGFCFVLFQFTEYFME